MRSVLSTLMALTALAGGCAAAAPPSIEAFAARPRIEGAVISPDGRYLALIQTQRGTAAVVVIERQGGASASRKVVLGEPENFRITWCRWATATRLLCAYRTSAESLGLYYIVTRLVAVDADGGHMLVLLQNADQTQGQFQDRVINWNPGVADTVLVEADEGIGNGALGAPSPNAVALGNVGTHAYPAVFELNIVTGRLNVRQHSRQPIRHWVTDQRGQVRLGWGFEGTEISYYARLEGDRDWRRLTKFEIFTRGVEFKPIAISDDDPNTAYAIAESNGRDALWRIDLADNSNASVLVSHPRVDVSGQIRSRHGTLVGVRYDAEYPAVYYLDPRSQAVIDAVKKALPTQFSVITDSTQDRALYVISSSSDVDPPSYRVFEVATGILTAIAQPYPDLPPASLAAMRPITYPARDGTMIPGYLSLPPGAPASGLPLIVMPHGGPIARDTWGYFFLRQFLLSRGYAVLQMNFRGSSGYGSDWFFAAHQAWGGLTYDDVVDATRWAIGQGIADPARVCIVGWSFGGYLALVAAQRNGELFHCAVSIAGVSDLRLLIDERYFNLAVRRQIGTDSDKLKRDSPRLHAADFGAPVLMLHGDRDAQVPFEHSQAMDSALTRAGKAHRLVAVHGADHQFSAEAARATVLREIEGFLRDNIGTTPVPVGRPAP
jgi:dipeptidyl aminopeptidase/acylaminoacyl peptidase